MEFRSSLNEPVGAMEPADIQSVKTSGSFSMKEQMAKYVWLEGRTRAQKALNVYGHIDYLRPYFSVEPKEVTTRLVESLIPRFGNPAKAVLNGELYGPLMVVLTMIALLLYGMKTSGHVVKEGTLMGTAFGVCFGYWLGASFAIYCLAYVCNTQISYIQTLSLTGYALFGHCLVIVLTTAFHPDPSHYFFFLLWAVVGGLSSLKMVCKLLN
ncbi:Protein yipf3 [Chamberlinius hualienensis]